MKRRKFIRNVCQFSAVAWGGMIPLSAIVASEADKSIIIYFSKTGSVEKLATVISSLTGAKTLRLELVNPYAENYGDMTDIAREERRTGARREIATEIPDLSQFETVYVGSPYWWGGLSIPMRTFLQDHPIQGKRLIPFCVSASSSPDGLWSDIQRICTKAKIENGFHITQGNADSAEAQIKNWLNSLKLLP